MNKPWYKSRTKVGAVLVGGGMILTAGGQVLLEEIDLAMGIVAIVTGVGIILAAMAFGMLLKKNSSDSDAF